MSFFYVVSQFLAGPADAPPAGPSDPEEIGEFITEPFSGSGSLSTPWTVPSGQTATLSGGAVQIVGTGSAKNVARVIRHTGYGLSTLRNYTITADFKLNTLGSNTKGFYIGVETAVNNSQLFSMYAILDHSTGNNALQLIATDNLGAIGNTMDSEIAGLPAINTSDTYRLTFEMNEGTVTGTLTNLTTSGTCAVSWDYNMNGVAPLRPNIFNYSLGVTGSSDVTVSNYKVVTAEKRNPKVVFVGDSISVGYSSGDPAITYPYLLRPKTAGDVQIMAGAGNNILNTVSNLAEIIDVNPTCVFLNIGTNSGGTFSDYQNIVSTLTAAGIIVFPCTTVNGGNPNTGGTLNNNIKTTYPSTWVNLWASPGQSVMSTGNGQMADSLHPSATGHPILANIIYAAKPDIFEL